MKELSFKSKLLFTTFGILLFCTVTLVALTLKQYSSLYQKSVKDNLQALAHNSAQELVPYIAKSPFDELGATTVLLKFDRYEHITLAQVYNINNELLTQFANTEYFNETKTEPSNNKEGVGLGITNKDGKLISVTHIGDEGVVLGYLVIQLDYQRELFASISAFSEQLLPMFFVLLCILFLVSKWAQGQFINPLLKLTELVENVRETKDYTLRFEHKNDDEISKFGDNLNDMLETIEHNIIEANRKNDKLLSQQHSLEYMANFDQLTDLPNRELFQELVTQARSQCKRDETHIAIMYLDLDNFKNINDSLGHNTGDLLLIEASRRINRQLRNVDILSRFGGDEFVIAATGLKDNIEAIVIAERILAAFKAAFILDQWEFSCGVSIGIVFSDDTDFKIDTMLFNADLAMYRAKKEGRNRYSVFEESMHFVQQRRLNIVNQLLPALSSNEFKLYYQPKVSPINGVQGLEVLIRWFSSFDDIISPAEFIPIAEHSGKMHDITRWVLDRGFKEQKIIEQSLPYSMVTSFNISAYDITNEKFIHYIKSKMREYDIDASSIEFEVTESAFIKNFSRASAFFKQLKEMGCNISLDDFGTGYSSLSYLTQVPASTLKIDQQFVRNIFASEPDRLIVDSIISLSKNLDLTICAEGIETEHEYNYIKDKGCDLVQGYYFAKPVPLEELPELVAQINSKVKAQSTQLT